MGKYVSIDFGSRAIKVIAMDGSPKRFTLTHFAEREIPARDGDVKEAMVQAVEAMFAEMRLSKEHVSVSIPAQECFFREFFVPFTSTEQIAKIIKFEAENYLPSTPIEDLIVDWYPISVEEGPPAKTKVLIAACPKENVAKVLDVLRRCEIDPTTIGLDITGLFTTCRALGAIDDSSTCVLVDLGARAMKIGLVQEGKLVHIRTPRVGTEVLLEPKAEGEDLGVLDKEVDLTDIDVGQLDLKELEKELIVSLSGFEDRKEAGSSEEEEAEARDGRQSALVGRMVREIVRTLAGRRMKTKAEKVLLAGGGIILPNLIEELGQKLQMEVVPVDVLGKVRHSLNGVDPAEFNHSLPVGIGIGLRQMGLATTDFDLRKEEFRFTRKFDQIRGVLVVAVCALFCVALALCYLVKGQIEQHRTILKAYLEPAMQPFSDVGLTEADWDREIKVAPEHQRLEKILGLVMGQMGGTSKPQDQTVLVVWNELARQIYRAIGAKRDDPPGTGPATFFLNRVEIRENRVTIQGEIEDDTWRERLLNTINESEFFSDKYAPNGPMNYGERPSKFNVTYVFKVPEGE